MPHLNFTVPPEVTALRLDTDALDIWLRDKLIILTESDNDAVALRAIEVIRTAARPDYDADPLGEIEDPDEAELIRTAIDYLERRGYEIKNASPP